MDAKDILVKKRYTSEALMEFINSTRLLAWTAAPEWAVGIIEYKDGGRFWISNDGLQLKEVTIKNPEDIDIVKSFRYLADAELLDLLESAWGIIISANSGEWNTAPSNWNKSAKLWLAAYDRVLKKAGLQNQEETIQGD